MNQVNGDGMSATRKVTDESLAQAARIIHDGGLIVIPTDTVYGVAVIRAMRLPSPASTNSSGVPDTRHCRFCLIPLTNLTSSDSNYLRR